MTLSFAKSFVFDAHKLLIIVMGDIDIIIKSLDPLRAKKTFIRKKLGHTMVSAIAETITMVSAIAETMGFSRNHGIAQLLRMYDIDFCDF